MITADDREDGAKELQHTGRSVEGWPQPALVVDGLSVEYGRVVAVDSVSLTVATGSVVGVIGPNGAGKTSLIDAITGFCAAVKGCVLLDGRDIARLPPARRARLGLGRTFQNLELFEDLTVRENLLAASDRRDWLAYFFNLVRPGSRSLSAEADLAVRVMGLTDVLDERPQDLPTGTQRLVAIARAVAARPKVLCLDEPSAGLSGHERQTFMRSIRELQAAFNLGILMVEHNVDVVAELCDEVVVLNFGEILTRGETAAVLASAIVRSAYLGETGTESQSDADVSAVRTSE